MLLKTNKRSKKRHSSRPKGSKTRLFICFFFVGLISFFCGYKFLQSYLVQPEALFVLGGHEQREKFAATFAQKHPDLPIWVSSGSPKQYVRRIFKNAGISRDRLHLDYQATDTVTNFTTLVSEFKAEGIDSVYLITSDTHMLRARLIGEIVFGSKGIVIKPISVPSNFPPEPIEKSIRDGARAVIWLFTGNAGENLIKKS